MLAKPETFDVVYAQNDSMALGAIDTLNSTPNIVGTGPGKILVVSIDTTKEALQSVFDGKLACTIDQGYRSGIGPLFDAVTKFYQGIPMPDTIDATITPYDKARIPSQAWIDAQP